MSSIPCLAVDATLTNACRQSKTMLDRHTTTLYSPLTLSGGPSVNALSEMTMMSLTSVR